MRFLVVTLALCWCLTVVYTSPRSARYNLEDIAREIEEDMLKDVDNVPPYRDTNQGFLEDENKNDLPVKDETKKNYYPPYLNKDDKYLELAREIVDEYKERNTVEQGSKPIQTRTANEALRAFNRQSLRTRLISEQTERENDELETLLLLASKDDPDILRELHGIDITARSARDDPTCDTEVNCNDEQNLNIVDGREFRTIDGTCNNKNNYTWGMAGTQHRRLLPDAYQNGRWEFRKFSVTSTRRPRVNVPLPSARNVSNVVHNSTNTKADNDDCIPIALFYFMQFIDHDLAKTPEGNAGTRDCCQEKPDSPRGYCMPIIVDVPDDHFPPNYCMDSRRSFTLFRCNDNTRFQNQINEITSYLDASMVYGSSKEEETTLRTFIGGRLKTSSEMLMPNSTHAAELPCNVTEKEYCYEAGDTRANVHAGLTTYHTIFVREHNRIAKKLTDIHSDWNDERIFQETRKIVGAEIQHIVYNELLPVLIREEERDTFGITKDYEYDPSIDASMTQAFSMMYRYHHLMPDQLHLAKVTESGEVHNFEEINQEFAYLKPTYLPYHNYDGIDEVALGMVASRCPYVNRLMNNASRNLLFLDKNSNSFDLVALNLMRGREWGMPSYSEYRAFCGLGNPTTWEDLQNTTDNEDITKMRTVYAHVRDVDLWTGCVTERKLPGSISGATQSCLVAKHFANVKHGDRFWYEGSFTSSQLVQIKKTSLARVLCDNLDVTTMREDVFDMESRWRSCNSVINRSGGEMDFAEF